MKSNSILFKLIPSYLIVFFFVAAYFLSKSGYPSFLNLFSFLPKLPNLEFVSYLIVILGSVNLIRMAIFLIGSDIYGLMRHIYKKKNNSLPYLPKFSVIIPAHNEEKNILTSVKSVIENYYPVSKLEVIVVDDGSTDNTFNIVKEYKEYNNLDNLKLVYQKNAGKAHALNNGMINHSSGELVMCLDSDSSLEKHAIMNAASYFEDPTVAALSANVKIREGAGLLNLIQRFEYIVCYQMKRAQTLFNIEYIIGGIGSTFRKSAIELVNYYDTDTFTEDIDLTMKIINQGNIDYKAIYGCDVIANTESVLNIKSLIKQRYRWKYGRSQTFYKNRKMFFSSEDKYTKLLTWIYLPYALFCDLAFFLEPLMMFYIFYVVLKYGDYLTLISAMSLCVGYIILNILAEDTLKLKEKIKYLLASPTMYFYMYVMSFVEYVALIKAMINIFNLKNSLKKNICSWQHVERAGA